MFKLNDIFYEDEHYTERAKFCNEKGYIIVEVAADEGRRRFQIQNIPEPTQEEIDVQKHYRLSTELAKIKEDIEQESFGLVRDDFAEKKARAAEIINELRVLEGKEPRKIK